jgi:hypothetical protein
MFVFVMSTYISVIWLVKDKPLALLVKRAIILISVFGTGLSAAFISLQVPLLIGLIFSHEVQHFHSLEAWLFYDFMLVLYMYIVGQSIHLMLQLMPMSPINDDGTPKRRNRWYDAEPSKMNTNTVTLREK